MKICFTNLKHESQIETRKNFRESEKCTQEERWKVNTDVCRKFIEQYPNICRLLLSVEATQLTICYSVLINLNTGFLYVVCNMVQYRLTLYCFFLIVNLIFCSVRTFFNNHLSKNNAIIWGINNFGLKCRLGVSILKITKGPWQADLTITQKLIHNLPIKCQMYD